MNRRTLLSYLGAIATMVTAAPLLRLVPELKAKTPWRFPRMIVPTDAVLYVGPRYHHFPVRSVNAHVVPVCHSTEANPLMCDLKGGILDCPSCLARLRGWIHLAKPDGGALCPEYQGDINSDRCEDRYIETSNPDRVNCWRCLRERSAKAV